MRLKHLLVASVSALLLSSCVSNANAGLKKEITAKEAEVILNQIKAKKDNNTNPYRFEYKSTEEYKNNDLEVLAVVDDEYVLAYNSSNELYCSYDNKLDGVLSHYNKRIIVKDKDEEEVCYFEHAWYSVSGEEITKSIGVATKKDNPIYDYQCKQLGANTELNESYFHSLISGEKYNAKSIQALIDDLEENDYYRVATTYKADKKGNMDIRVMIIDIESGETACDETISFNDYSFTRFVSVEKYGNTKTINASIKYCDNSFSLPSGWKDYILKKGLTSFPSEVVASFLSNNNVTEEIPNLAQQSAAYEYYIDSNSYNEDALVVRIFVPNVASAMTAIRNAFPNTWDLRETFIDNGVVIEYSFYSPLEQLEIEVHTPGDSWVTVTYRPIVSN